MRASLTAEYPEPVSLAPHRLAASVCTVASDTARLDQRCHTWSSTAPLCRTKYRESRIRLPENLACRFDQSAHQLIQLFLVRPSVILTADGELPNERLHLRPSIVATQFYELLWSRSPSHSRSRCIIRLILLRVEADLLTSRSPHRLRLSVWPSTS